MPRKEWLILLDGIIEALKLGEYLSWNLGDEQDFMNQKRDNHHRQLHLYTQT